MNNTYKKGHARTCFKGGFTLIELLVVIAIIGLLSTIVLVALNEARAKGRDTAKIAAMTELRKALALYYSDNGAYPYTDNLDVLIEGKYIPSIIEANIIYYRGAQTVDGSGYGSGCFIDDPVCKSYMIGVMLERKNTVLDSDKDFYIQSPYDYRSVFSGLSTDQCKVTSAGNTPSTNDDRCYDLTSF